MKREFKYDWEALLDYEENVLDAVNELVGNNSGEFTGTIKITVEYIK